MRNFFDSKIAACESRFFFVSIDTLTVAISSPTIGVMPVSTSHRAI
jgi:hypothetical protein